jgi:hypothetical protein
MEGWIKLHRKSIESIVFGNEKCWKIWCWCLLRAGHKDNTFLLGREKINIKTGQFVMGLKKTSEEINLAVSTIHYWLKFLEDEGMVELKKTNKYTIITILNWGKYQLLELKKNSNQNANGTLKETNKNDKNDNNEKEGLSNESIPSKTYKGFRDQRRIESGRPPMTPRKSTEKQKAFMAAAKTGIDYFKAQGQEQHGMQFLEYTNDKRNAIVLKLVMNAYEKIGDLKELIDWWFQGEGEWADYEPERCFSIKTIERFKNKQPKQKRGFIINKQNE